MLQRGAMPTGPYQKIFRRLHSRATPRSDIHAIQADMPLLTDPRSLELFAQALSKFVDNGTDKSMVEATRYKRSTFGLALTLAALLSADVMLLLFGNLRISPSPSVERAETTVLEVPPVAVTSTPTDRSLVHMQQQFAATVHLQIEQSSYLTQVIADVAARKRVRTKPPSLVAAETALLKLTSS